MSRSRHAAAPRANASCLPDVPRRRKPCQPRASPRDHLRHGIGVFSLSPPPAADVPDRVWPRRGVAPFTLVSERVEKGVPSFYRILSVHGTFHLCPFRNETRGSVAR